MKEYKIDIHGMTENDAYCALIEFLGRVPPGAKKVIVVHGFKGGTVLKEMVKNFHHHRVDYIMQPLYNEGESLIYLK